MKINNNGIERYKSFVQAVRKEESVAGKNKAHSAMPANMDKVTLSEEATSFAAARSLAAPLAAEVETAGAPARVEELRVAVANGSYFVSAENVADAILEGRA